MNNTVVEIDGCKISPEFIELLNRTLLRNHDQLEDFKKSLFRIQYAIINNIVTTEEIPEDLDMINYSIYNINLFVTELEDLRFAGKF